MHKNMLCTGIIVKS